MLKFASLHSCTLYKFRYGPSSADASKRTLGTLRNIGTSNHKEDDVVSFREEAWEEIMMERKNILGALDYQEDPEPGQKRGKKSTTNPSGNKEK